MADILDKMTSYVNHRSDLNTNNNDKDLVNMIRNNLVKARQLNAKIHAHNMAVRAQNHKNTNNTHRTEIIVPPPTHPNTTSRPKQRVIMDKSVITNNIIF